MTVKNKTIFDLAVTLIITDVDIISVGFNWAKTNITSTSEAWDQSHEECYVCHQVNMLSTAFPKQGLR